MPYLTVSVDGISPYDADNFQVSYSYAAVPASAENTVSGNGQATFPISTLSAVVNSSIVDVCLAQAASQGVTLGPLDRKILASGLI